MNIPIEELVKLVLAGLGVAATVAAITPNTSDNVVLSLIYKFINLLGQNVGNAKNKE